MTTEKMITFEVILKIFANIRRRSVLVRSLTSSSVCCFLRWRTFEMRRFVFDSWEMKRVRDSSMMRGRVRIADAHGGGGFRQQARWRHAGDGIHLEHEWFIVRGEEKIDAGIDFEIERPVRGERERLHAAGDVFAERRGQ